MSVPAITTDIHGNRYAPVHVEELDEWAWTLGRPVDPRDGHGPAPWGELRGP